jgi:hypothetical protein
MSTPPTTPSGVIDAEIGDMKPELLLVAGSGLGIGVIIFVLKKGWRLLKGFTS